LRIFAVRDNGSVARGRAWVSSRRLASSLELPPGKLASPLVQLEADGLVVTRRNANGTTSIKLTRLAGPVANPARAASRPSLNLALDEDTPHASLVLALAGMPHAVETLDALASHLDRDYNQLCRECIAAELSGMVDLWPDAPSGPSVCLATLAAGRLGLILSCDGTRWLRPGMFDPTSIDGPSPFSVETDITEPDGPSPLAFVPVPNARTAEEQAIADETADRHAARLEAEPEPEPTAKDYAANPDGKRTRWDRDRTRSILDGEAIGGDPERRIPRPTKLWGMGRAWPVMTPGSNPLRPWTHGDGPCPECHGDPLARSEACVICDSMGVQELLDRIESDIPAPPPKPLYRPVSTSLKGGMG
jgi:hypothetical protein